MNTNNLGFRLNEPKEYQNKKKKNQPISFSGFKIKDGNISDSNF